MRKLKKIIIILMCFSILMESIIWNYTIADEITDVEVDNENIYEIVEFLELNNKNGEHLWERKEDVIYHEEKGHTERVLCTIYTFYCRGCGGSWDSLDEFRHHDGGNCGASSYYWTTEETYKDVWIVDSVAWNEVVSEYYQCKFCNQKMDLSEFVFESTTVKAIIPTTINIKGKTGVYNVMAYCKTENLSKLNTGICISPEKEFTLTDGIRSVTATVFQPKTSFSISDVQNGGEGMISVMVCNGSTNEQEIKKVSTEGTIIANDISYGTWTGSMRFIISSEEY